MPPAVRSTQRFSTPLYNIPGCGVRQTTTEVSTGVTAGGEADDESGAPTNHNYNHETFPTAAHIDFKATAEVMGIETPFTS